MNSNQTMRLYLKEHLSLYIFVAILFLMGIIFGALMVNSLSLEQKQEMARHLSSFLHAIDQGTEIGGKSSVQQSFMLHVKWIALIWVLGLSVVGLPLILILNFFKGVLVGFTVGYLAGQLSYKGLLFALVSVAPQNIILVPALLIVSVTAIAFSVFLIKNRFLHGKGMVYQQFVHYSLITVSMVVVMFGVSLFEAYISPIMMKWVTPMIVALYE